MYELTSCVCDRTDFLMIGMNSSMGAKALGAST